MFHALKPNAKALFGALALLCLPLTGAHATETILKNFSNSFTNGAYPVGQLVFSGGAFYGVTEQGVNGDGDIFKMTTKGAVTILHELNRGNGDGYFPNAGMILVGSNLYGTTLNGGSSGSTGVLFRIGTNGSGFTVLHNFTGYNSSNPSASDGSYVYAGLLLASDGNLYGTTYTGGSNNQGSVFMYNPSNGSYSLIHSFNNTTDTAYGPIGALAEGTDGFLYGAAYNASGYNSGLYKLNKDGSGYAFVHGFSSSDPAGYSANTDLITASDGNIYGMCQYGGANGLGTVFKLVPSTGTVSPLWAFDLTTGAYPGPYNGYYTQTRLIQGSDHNLYGVTQQGGFYGYGTAFKLTLAGVCTALTNFNYNNTLGTANPLVQDGTSLYCTSYYGGIFTYPNTFSGYGAAISISSTGAIKLLQTFHQQDGTNPFAGLVQVGMSFYGEASNSGEYGGGYIYSVNAAGHFTILHHMNNDGDHLEGYYPEGGLLLDGTSLYGTTWSGGEYGRGTLFKITTKGVITILHHLNPNNLEGDRPYSALTMGAGTDKNLYGTLGSGSPKGYGSVFSTNTSGTSFRIIHYFDGPDGAYPECTPVPDGAGNLWGTCYAGGVANYGTIWKLATNGSTFTKVFDFIDNVNGAYPWYDGHLYLINGILYGTAAAGGAYNAGVIFAFNTSTSAMNLLYTFNNSNGDGYNPVGLYYDSAGGNFYGCCDQGGIYGNGTVWKVNISTGTFTKLYDFAGYNNNPPTYDGYNPYYAPILGSDGNLYGTTVFGGTFGAYSASGTVYKVTP